MIDNREEEGFKMGESSRIRITLRAGEPGFLNKAKLLGIDISDIKQQQEVTFVAEIEIKNGIDDKGDEDMKTRFG